MQNRQIDVGIITIISAEIEAVFKTFDITPDQIIETSSPYTYWRSEFYSHQSQRTISVVVSFLSREAGNTEAGICTSYFLQDWYPRLMCLVGIAAGIKSKVRIGDVVIPNKVHDRTNKIYRKGTYSVRGNSTTRIDAIERMVKIRPISDKEFRLQYTNELNDILDNMKNLALSVGCSEAEYNGEFSIHDGSLSSDNILIRDSSYFDGIIEETDEKCRAGDMESAGFVRACQVEDLSFPWIIFRGISDFGDSNKDDNFQLLAARNACIALRLYLEKTIAVHDLPDNPRSKGHDSTLEFNLLAQIKDAYASGRWQEVCRYGNVLSRHLWLSGQYEYRIAIGKMVEEAASFIDDNLTRARTLIDDLGWTSFSIGKHMKAQRYVKDGLRIANEIGNQYLLAKGNRHLASMARRNGELDVATTLLERASEYCKLIKDVDEKNEMTSALLVSKGKLLIEKGELSQAVEMFKTGINQFREIEDEPREVKIYSLLGKTYIKMGKVNEAIRHFQEGRRIAFYIGRYDEISDNTKLLIECLGEEYREEKLRMAQEVLEFTKSKGLLTEAKAWRKIAEKLY